MNASAQIRPVQLDTDPDDFCRTYINYVWRCLRHLRVPAADLPDATQDVLVAATRNLHKYEGRGSVKSWLYGFAKYVSKSYGRSAWREQRKRDALEHVTPDCGCDPIAALEGEQSAIALLNSLLAELDEDKRYVYILADIEEIPIVDIAREIGVKTNTLHTRLFAARKQMRAAAARYLAHQSIQP